MRLRMQTEIHGDLASFKVEQGDGSAVPVSTGGIY
jgi:hypothetical protein